MATGACNPSIERRGRQVLRFHWLASLPQTASSGSVRDCLKAIKQRAIGKGTQCYSLAFCVHAGTCTLCTYIHTHVHVPHTTCIIEIMWIVRETPDIELLTHTFENTNKTIYTCTYTHIHHTCTQHQIEDWTEGWARNLGSSGHWNTLEVHQKVRAEPTPYRQVLSSLPMQASL